MSWLDPLAAGNSLVVQDEGTPLPARNLLDVQGEGVTVTAEGNKLVMNIPGGSTTVQSEGTPLTASGLLNVKGDGVKAEYNPITGAIDLVVPGDGKVLTASGSDDAGALHGALLDAPVVRLVSGNYELSSAITVGAAGTTLKATRGTRIVITDDVIIQGLFEAPKDEPIFDVQSGGSLSLPHMSFVYPAWFFATGDGATNDRPAFERATNALLMGGGIVSIPRPRIAYLFDDPLDVGEAGVVGQQGVTWACDAENYGPYLYGAFFVAGTGFDAMRGAPMLRVTDTMRFEVWGGGFDANGHADYCVQVRGSGLANSWPAWGSVFRGVGFHSAKVMPLVNGYEIVEATYDPSTGTFTCAGHPFTANQNLYLIEPISGVDVHPSAFPLDALYFVVSPTTNTFKLSTSSGGSATTGGTVGSGRWVVMRANPLGDSSLMQVERCTFTPDTTGARGSSSGAISQIGIFGSQNFGIRIVSCMFQGVGNPVAVTCDATANTFTHSGASGDYADGDRIQVWARDTHTGGGGDDVQPGGITRDQMYVVMDYNSGTKTGKLCATPGASAIDITSAGGPNLLIARMDSPFRIMINEGAASLESNISASYFESVRLFGRPNGIGVQLHMSNEQSQDWRLLHADNTVTEVPQIGSVVLTNCTSADIIGGSSRSIDWKMPNYTGLVVTGGTYYNDINVGSGNVAPVRVTMSNLVNDPLSPIAKVTGDMTYVIAEWFEAGAVKTNYARVDVAGSVRSTSTVLPLGVAGRDMWQVKEGGGADQSIFALASGQESATIDASGAATNGFVQIKTKVGADSSQGIFADADVIRHRTAIGALLSTWSNPSSNDATLTAAGALVVNGTSGVTLQYNGAGFLTATSTLTLAPTSSQANLVLDASAGSTGYVQLKTKSGQPIYIDADTHNFRTQAASLFLAVSCPSGTNASLLAQGATMTLGMSNVAALDLSAGKIALASGQSTLTIDASAGSTGYIQLLTKSGQPIYIDSDTQNFRSAAGGQFLAVSTPGASSATLLTAGAMLLSATSGLTVNTGGGPTTYFAVDASGNVLAGVGQYPVFFGPQGSVTVGATVLALNAHVDTTISITGAAVGDMVIVNPSATPDGNVGWCGWVSATNQVTVRVFALAALTTASTTYAARVVKV